jgi:hypothetical protein
MGKIIGLIACILLMLAGIVVLALGPGIGLLMLLVGMLGTVMMGFLVSASGGSIADIFSGRGFFDPFMKIKREKKNENANIWDAMSQKRDE